MDSYKEDCYKNILLMYIFDFAGYFKKRTEDYAVILNNPELFDKIVNYICQNDTGIIAYDERSEEHHRFFVVTQSINAENEQAQYTFNNNDAKCMKFDDILKAVNIKL